MTIEVVALDHLYLTVSDLRAAERFYDPVMRLLDFRRSAGTIAGDPHIHYYNRVLQLTIRPARSPRQHDPYAPGLHHLCLRVQTRAEVDEAARGLRDLGLTVSEPTTYPEYAPDYYAVFFEDPDGIRLEVVAEFEERRRIRERW